MRKNDDLCFRQNPYDLSDILGDDDDDDVDGRDNKLQSTNKTANINSSADTASSLSKSASVSIGTKKYCYCCQIVC